MEKIDMPRFIHISLDDTIFVFHDLTTNVNTYKSIFENNLLKFLNKCHDTYGAVFSLYCFYDWYGGALHQCADKFLAEFNEQANWLRIGFHGVNENFILKDKSNFDLANVYNHMIKEIGRIAGDNVIDRVVRLHCFSGLRDSLKQLHRLKKGIVGLYVSDKKEKSYYLGDEDIRFIFGHGAAYDNLNDLYFFPTDIRLETEDKEYDKLCRLSGERNGGIEVFTHEWLFDEAIEKKVVNVCEFAKINQYEWAFPMDHLSKL